MGRIPDETIQAIRDRVDLVELVGRFVSLRASGRNHKGRCPFHDEKTPSFNVNADRQIYHCFGCGAGGNAFGFLMQHENLTFPEAVRELGRQVGIEVSEGDPAQAGLYERLRQLNDVAQEFFRAELASSRGADARRYLAERGLDAEIAERFAIGVAPDAWDGLGDELRRRKIPADLAEKAGLLVARNSGGHYDRLRGRVVFPIRDARGRILGFGGRATAPDQEPKYLNGPETPIYRKREVLFGLPLALEPMRRSERAVVVEGYFDVVALHRAGVGETVATCGTALTEDHARELCRRTREVVLLFDGDDAGRRAARSALEVLLPTGLRVRHVALPSGDDPDTLLAREGPEALAKLVDGAPPALEAQIREACAAGLATPWERADAVHAVAPLVARVVDPVERGEFARLLAMRTGVREEDVDAAVRGARHGDVGDDALEAPAPRRRGPEDRWFRNLVAAVLDHPHLAARVPLDELALLFPDSPALRAAGDVLGCLGNGGDPVSQLDGEASALYTELATADRPPFDEEAASRAIGETVENLRRRSHRRERSESTRALARGDAVDSDELLDLKEEQLRRRRELWTQPPDPTRH